MSIADIVRIGWDHVAAGDWDALLADYFEDVMFVMPGQDDVLRGRAALRGALENLGAILPRGFAITGLRHIEGDAEVVTIVEWSADDVPAPQLAVLFRFRGDKVFEERWFVDTEQWKAAL